MKKYFLSLLLLLSLGTSAFAQDDYVSGMMTKRKLTCDDIGYNAAALIPKMYFENKPDTLDAIVNFWEKNCGMTEPATSLSILYAIRQNTFNRQLKGLRTGSFTDTAISDTGYFNKNILPNLYAYKYAYNSRPASDSGLDDAAIAYRNYYDMLYSMATSMLSATDLSVTEKFLVRYYHNPDSTHIEEWAANAYDTTIIRPIYARHMLTTRSLNGTDYALTAGAWMPQGNISLLGSGPYIGGLLGGKRNRWTFDFDFYINFPVQHTPTYMVSNHDSLTASNTYLGFYAGLDAGYALLQKNKHELDILGCLAYQGIQVLNGNGNTAVLTISSFNPNFGLGYKFYFKQRVKYDSEDDTYTTHHSYIGLVAKYNFLFFNNNPGTSLSGNAFTVGLIYGRCSKNRKFYNKSTDSSSNK